MAKRKTYDGKDISISFDMSRCIHARNCFLKLPQVFDPARRPWVEPDAAPAEEIAAMIRTCPSGALAFSRHDGGTEEVVAGVNRIAVLENGPLALTGAFHVDGVDTGRRLTLCRCGLSKNKPFCDCSHVEGGFTATGEPSETTHDSAEGLDGPVEVTGIADGPLKVAGNLEITTGTGRKIARTAKTFLCRCGHSNSKPFCDGSHKKAGFRTTGDT